MDPGHEDASPHPVKDEAEDHIQPEPMSTPIDFVTLGMFIIGESLHSTAHHSPSLLFLARTIH
jgi:hypothetical protein